MTLVTLVAMEASRDDWEGLNSESESDRSIIGLVGPVMDIV